MQVANIAAKPVQTSSQNKQTASADHVDFSNALSQKIGEAEANASEKKANKDVHALSDSQGEDQKTPQVVEIPITDAMLQLMAVFAQPEMQVEIETPVTATDAQVIAIETLTQTGDLKEQLSPVPTVTVSPNTVTMEPDENVLVKPSQVNEGVSTKNQVIPHNIDAQEKSTVTTAENQVKQPVAIAEAVTTTVEPVVTSKSNVTTDVNDVDVTDGDADALVKTDEATKVQEVSSKQSGNTDDGFNDGEANDDANKTATFELQSNKSLVKISDSATKLDAPKVQPPQAQLVDSMKENIKNGKTEFEMQLTPVNLGKITVKMVSENGVLTVEFLADNPKTQSLLMSSVSEIRDLIQGSVNPTTQVSTPNNSENLPQNYTQQQNNQNQQEQNNQEQQGNEASKNQQEQNETSTVDFLTMLQQLKTQSRLTRS